MAWEWSIILTISTFEQLTAHHTPTSLVVSGVLGILAIYLAWKIAHFLIRLFLAVIGLALLASIAGWFYYHH